MVVRQDLDDLDGERIVLRPAVKWFAEQMELALRRNDHKSGWEMCTDEYLWAKLKEEVKELRDELRWNTVMVIQESADVANIVMMIADNKRRVGKAPD